ncbi:PREDICTED: uncharacterized protein LOC109218447 [Nicotiana attenuata]|uniref:uncharacterized protein LOC109218447 n=1 Tax=Nicotiana attenuata TaxID=49451 RepID=UPI000905B819|nr:PREDICTED: uncharacterized protein LOC109218447 [Nicotiana attenuata]
MQMLGKGSENSGSAMAAGMAHNAILPEDKPKWIIDTGASNRMVHRIDMMFDLKHLGQSKVGKVCLPKGDLATITKELKCVAMFFPDFCIFQDLFGGQLKGIGKEHYGLYVLTSGSIIQAIDDAPTARNSSSVPRSLNVNTTKVPTYDGKRTAQVTRHHHQSSCVYTSQQNGVAERRHRHKLNVARTLRFQASVPLRFWGECVTTAIYLINKLPTSILKGKTPYEVLHGAPTSLTHLRVFGYLGYVSEVRRTDKFAPRAIPVVFLVYFVVQKGYKMYTISSREFTVSRDVVFKEDVYPFKHTTSPISSVLPVLEFSLDTNSESNITVPY